MKKDLRGFAVFTTFEDTYGATVTIKESSSAEGKRGWLFVKGGGIKNNDGAVHFDNRQARRMIKALENYLKLP